MLEETQTLSRKQLENISQEAKELAAIFSASLKTAKGNG